ncbi:YkgJ family cysteine cluster protein [Leucothrix pacifica]|uniref:YkgJ family cysteine cluster protein n=1 Tax=Leucothrix pacifica TaxID=1247513 RepID=UPI0011B263E6|nr:YkgJ family cysteine cluster protein [Leucothrix pacifica]
MNCRKHCGACCIAPSISSPLPNMPEGKAAGELCANLDPHTLSCKIWGTAQYPDVCKNFKPSAESCGDSREEAMETLMFFEVETMPAPLK